MARFRIEIPGRNIAAAPASLVGVLIVCLWDPATRYERRPDADVWVLEGEADQAVVTDLMTLARCEW